MVQKGSLGTDFRKEKNFSQEIKSNQLHGKVLAKMVDIVIFETTNPCFPSTIGPTTQARL